MKLMVRVCFIMLAILSVVHYAEAERLTLKEAVHTALRDNPGLKAYHWRLQAQREDVNAAKGLLYPTLRIEEKFRRTNNPTYGFMAKLNQERFTQEDFLIQRLNNPADISNFETSLTFEQPVYVPGVYAGIKMAGKELEAKEAEYRRSKETVALKVLKTFNMIQSYREYLNAAQKGIEDAREHKRLATLRYDAGTGLYSDMLRAEVALKEAKVVNVKAESNLEIAGRALGLIVGRTGPVDTAGDAPLLLLNDVKSYLNASLQREDLKALRSRYHGSREAVKKEKSVFLPSVGIGGSYFLNDHNSPFSLEAESYMVTGVLRWNLFDASVNGKIRKAKNRAHEAEEYLSGLEKEIHFQVNEAYTRAGEKEQNLSLARAVVNEAGEALRLVRTRYENSLAPIVDLLDTQLMLDNARAGLTWAENEYLNAIADLYYQSGLLMSTLLHE